MAEAEIAISIKDLDEFMIIVSCLSDWAEWLKIRDTPMSEQEAALLKSITDFEEKMGEDENL